MWCETNIDKPKLDVRKQWLISLICFTAFLCVMVLTFNLMEHNYLINHIPLRTFIYLVFSLVAPHLVEGFALYYWAYRKQGTSWILFHLCFRPIYFGHYIITNPDINAAPLNVALLLVAILVVPAIFFWIQSLRMYRVNKAHWATFDKDYVYAKTTNFASLFGLFLFFSPHRFIPKVYTPAPIQQAAYREISEKIRNANKQADGYTLTDEDKRILDYGYSKHLEYELLEDKDLSSFKKRLSPKDPADTLTFIILNESNKRAWALGGEFMLRVLRAQQELDPNNYKDILGT